MGTLLVKNALVLATMDAQRREITDGGLFARNGFIESVGRSKELPTHADEVFDATGHVVLPGLINTHHHLYQTLTRAVPTAQNVGLFDWLKALYPVWAMLDPDSVFLSTQLGLAELALTGCTTTSDHLYLYPNGVTLADQVAAAAEVGVRFHVGRGSMSLGESDGGLPPDSVVEDETSILAATQAAIEDHHDPTPGAMTRVVVAPCSPFSVTTDLMREAAALARACGVHLHTHLAETLDEETFCLDTYGMRPVQLAESLGWVGEDVWFAHGVFVNAAEQHLLAETRTGVAHCPSSNMRLASGIAPLAGYRSQGVPVGIGVDGSASNDSSHMLAEIRQTMLIARLAASPQLHSRDAGLVGAREVLELGTLGGATVLGRTDIGSLEVGKCADAVAIDMRRVEFAGALHDPVAALVFGAPVRVDRSYVHGRPLVVDGTMATIDERELSHRHNLAAARLLG